MKKNKNNKGFSLVELVIVVAILAILVGILAPQYTKYVERSRKSADVANLDQLVQAVKIAAADESYDLAAGNIVITITDKGTTVQKSASGGDRNLKDALEEYCGGTWITDGKALNEQIKLKSSKWKNGKAAVTEIKATCAISETGAVTVTYVPADIQDQMKNTAEN